MQCMSGITAWTALFALLPVVQCPPAEAGCLMEVKCRESGYFTCMAVHVAFFYVFTNLPPIIIIIIIISLLLLPFPFVLLHNADEANTAPNSQEPCHPIRYPVGPCVLHACQDSMHPLMTASRLVSPRSKSLSASSLDSPFSFLFFFPLDRNGPMQLGGGC